jgi:hypothetical protein
MWPAASIAVLRSGNFGLGYRDPDRKAVGIEGALSPRDAVKWFASARRTLT